MESAGEETDRRAAGPAAEAAPAESPAPAEAPVPTPSGLFPAGPPRRTYREPHPVRPGPVVAGLIAGLLWLALFALLGDALASRIWWAVAAGTVSWGTALGLVRYGDRGVAVGLALATGLGWGICGGVVALDWALTGDWPLW